MKGIPLQNRPVVALALSIGYFATGMTLAAVIFYTNGAYTWKDAVISNFLSLSTNSHGYLFACVGMIASGLMLVPLQVFLHRTIHSPHRMARTAALIIFCIGTLGLAAMGAMAIVVDSFGDLHVRMTFATLAGLVAAIITYSGILLHATPRTRSPQRMLLKVLITLMLAVLAFLIYVYITPEYLSDKSIWTSIAVCEWIICLVLGMCLYLLIRCVDSGLQP